MLQRFGVYIIGHNIDNQPMMSKLWISVDRRDCLWPDVSCVDLYEMGLAAAFTIVDHSILGVVNAIIVIIIRAFWGILPAHIAIGEQFSK